MDARALIASIRQNHPQWHEIQQLCEMADALLDYWEGCDPDAETYNTRKDFVNCQRVRALLEPKP